MASKSSDVTDEGIRTIRSKYAFEETVSQLKNVIHDKGIKLFCEIDHSAEAEMVGLAMPKTRVLIFGNAKAGTPIMLEAPSAALDLPLKILVASSEDGLVSVSWTDPAWLRRRHGFKVESEASIKAAEILAAAVAVPSERH